MISFIKIWGLIPALPNRRDPYVMKWSIITEHHRDFLNWLVKPQSKMGFDDPTNGSRSQKFM